MRLGTAVGALAIAGLAAIPADAGGISIGIVLGHHHDHGYARTPDTYDIGFDRGYRDGAGHGEKDARKRRGYDFAHDKKYRCGSGYKRHYGPHHEYLAGYQRGYEQGYRRAYAGWRHRHHGQEGYCDLRHDDRYRRGEPYRDHGRHDDRSRWRGRDGDIIYEEPAYRR